MQSSADLQCPEGRCAIVIHLRQPDFLMQLLSKDLCSHNKALQLQVHLQLSFSSNFNTTPELNGHKKGIVAEDEGGHPTNGLANGHAEAAPPASKYVGVQVSSSAFTVNFRSTMWAPFGGQMCLGLVKSSVDVSPWKGWQVGVAWLNQLPH